MARLSNLESHGDSLDDLIKLPAMTVEESKGAAACLFRLIEMLDPEHFKGMKSMSRRANPVAVDTPAPARVFAAAPPPPPAPSAIAAHLGGAEPNVAASAQNAGSPPPPEPAP